MRGWFGFVVLVAAAAPAAAQPAGEVDVTAVRDRMAVFSDGKGHLLAGVFLDPDRDDPSGPAAAAYKDAARWFFQGSEKELQRIGTASSFGRAERDGRKILEYWFRDPRVYPATYGEPGVGQVLFGVFRVVGDTGQVGCTVPARSYTRLPPERARAILERARFRQAPPERRAHLLARDAQGVYYYVDRIGEGMGFRLFVGRRGRMKQMKLVDAAEDSEGTLLVMARNSLAASIDRGQATWIAGKTSTPLTFVPVDANKRLVFTQLGVYDGVAFGTPCD